MNDDDRIGFGYTTRRPGELDLSATEEVLRAEGRRRGLRWGSLFVDPFIARTKHFGSRPAGFCVMRPRGRRGDALLVRELFDAFRTAADCKSQLATFQWQGITLVSLDGALDSPAAFDQWCKSLHRLRALEAMAVARATDQPTGRPPLGFRWIGPRGRRRLVPDPAELGIMREAYELSAEGRSRTEVTRRLMLAGRRSPRTRREWSPTTARRAIDAYKALLELGVVPA